MSSDKKIKYLVVDTSAFIKGAPLQDIAENVVTIQEVIDEVTSKRQLRKLVVLPYDLKVKDVFVENIKFITEFSKKTGDYTSLSATDIKVMALTYQTEKELVGTDHLKSEPTFQKTIKVTGLGNMKKTDIEDTNSENKVKNDEANESSTHENLHKSLTEKLNLADKEATNAESTNIEQKYTRCENEIIDNCEVDVVDEEILVKAEDSDTETEEDSEDDNDSDSENGEWITPSNIQEKKKEMDMGDLEDKPAEVACITTDFAMQNVLKQIGLNVTSVDGRLIRHVRTFIFRCTTCFKTTSVMTKIFCPKCGHATLKKVAVSVDEDGNQQIHINGRKPLTARGKRFSLPTPKGGQHFQYPILTEDQHIHKRKATRLAQKKNNPLDPDYIAGFSPFIMRDVNSKSAVLGVRSDKQDMKAWLRKSANDVRKKRK